MLENFLQNVRKRLYARGLESRSRADKFRVKGHPITRVSVPTGYLAFFDEQRAHAWAQENKGRDIHTFDHGLIEPATMKWLIAQREKGIDTGSLHGRIMYASPQNFDDMVAWFVREPDPAAAIELLKFAFAVNRPDATDTVAQWAQKYPQDWFNPDKLVGTDEDRRGERFQAVHDVCLFGRLIPEAHLMAWLFEHQPHMKHEVMDPQRWNPLQAKLKELDPMQVAYWPAAAHKAFARDVDPLQDHWPLESFGFLCKAMPAYAHDPATQSYFVHQFVGLPVTDLLVEHATPEVREMHHRIQLAADGNHTRPENLPPYDHDKVEALMLGVHLGLGSKDFYYHAKTVFAQPHEIQHQTQYADLDASIF